MNKNILMIAGIVVILGLITTTVFGITDLVTAGSIISTTLGLLYGWYQKLNSNEAKSELLDMKMQMEMFLIKYKPVTKSKK